MHRFADKQPGFIAKFLSISLTRFFSIASEFFLLIAPRSISKLQHCYTIEDSHLSSVNSRCIHENVNASKNSIHRISAIVQSAINSLGLYRLPNSLIPRLFSYLPKNNNDNDPILSKNGRMSRGIL